MTDRDGWLALHFSGLTRPMIRRLVALAGSPAGVLELGAQRCAPLAGPQRERTAGLLLSGAALDSARGEELRAERLGVRLLTPADPGYPQGVARSADPAPVLWLAGDESQLARRMVAVVGARQASAPGLAAARALARGLAGCGLSVVSGLARGIDGAAHTGALEAPGATVAVLGSALDVVYPWAHRQLARRIARSGVLLSEHRLGTGPRPHHFPERNRLIASLAEAVVVVEAGPRSGALITARLAADEGRDVMALPGTPWDPLHAGTNALIQDGARLVQHLGDVLSELGVVAPPAAAQPGPELSDKEGRVLARLGSEAARGIDELARETDLPTPELLALLGALELRELITQLPGGRYLRLAHRSDMAY